MDVSPPIYDHARDSWRFAPGDLVGAFRKFQDEGRIEIITTAATHGLLPLLANHPPSVRAQILTARDHYRSCFGRDPRGIWLPECAYISGVENFFAGGEHPLVHPRHARRPARAPASALRHVRADFTPNGIAAFGRDYDSSRQVWSKHEGYPGDPRYRDFYRDIGFDLDFDYVKPHLPSPETRGFTGMKYYRITGGTGEKEIYQRDHALAGRERTRAAFSQRTRGAGRGRLAGLLDRPPLIVAPYDAELFGHWWYEGPEFLDFLARKLVHDQKIISLITPGEYLHRHPTNQIATPSASSWGEEGYLRAWLNETNEWIYPHLQVAQERMSALAKKFSKRKSTTALQNARVEAGRARTAAGAGQRLAVHFARGHQSRLRAPPREGPSAPLHRAARSVDRHERGRKMAGRNRVARQLFPDVDWNYWK